jgi:hypothetical protein
VKVITLVESGAHCLCHCFRCCRLAAPTHPHDQDNPPHSRPQLASCLVRAPVGPSTCRAPLHGTAPPLDQLLQRSEKHSPREGPGPVTSRHLVRFALAPSVGVIEKTTLLSCNQRADKTMFCAWDTTQKYSRVRSNTCLQYWCQQCRKEREKFEVPFLRVTIITL